MATRPQHGRGRLAAARELRNRQVDEAHEAFHRMQVAVASFDDSMQMRVAEGDERPLKEVEAAVQECMAKVRVLPLKPKLMAPLLIQWATVLQDCDRRHRAVPVLLEALAMIGHPPQDRHGASMVVWANCMLGENLTHLGRLQEAETHLLRADEVYKGMRPPKPDFPALPSYFLAPLYLELGRFAEAKAHADVAVGVLAKLEGEVDPVHFYECLSVEIEAAVAGMTTKEGKPMGLYLYMDMPVSDVTRYRCVTTMARMHMEDGDAAKAVEVLTPAFKHYKECQEGSLRYTGAALRKGLAAMRVLVAAWRALGKEAEAHALELDVEETEAILDSVRAAALNELREEMRAGAAAEAAAGQQGGQQPKKKKPGRKQQKRKAAQRRKAEAAAAAGEGPAGEAAGPEAQESEAASKKEEEESVEKATAAAAQLQIEETEPAPALAPEPEECAICLTDLPLPGSEEGGGVLLACSHAFHAACLECWKAKCLEKGLRFTCAMCRETVVVVTSDARV